MERSYLQLSYDSVLKSLWTLNCIIAYGFATSLASKFGIVLQLLSLSKSKNLLLFRSEVPFTPLFWASVGKMVGSLRQNVTETDITTVVILGTIISLLFISVIIIVSVIGGASLREL